MRLAANALISLLLYVKALRTATGAEDEDAPPPWLVKASPMPPVAAFGAGAGLMTLSVKFLIFALGAISAITDAQIGAKLSVLTFVVFVALAQGVPFGLLVIGSASSSRSAAILEGMETWLRRNNRRITVLFGLVFGTWFLLKALSRLGVI